MTKTKIEWASHSWNPYTWDCTRVSPGCQNCYMMVMAERYKKQLVGRPKWRGKNAMKELRKMDAGSVIFVNSMSDTYHESVPVQWIHSIHNIAALHPDKIFLLLTKRPERALALSPYLTYPDNLWVGTSVESNDYLWRLDYLLQIPAAGHFLSAEPLLEDIATGLKSYLYAHQYHPYSPEQRITFQRRTSGYTFLNALKWVIVGGESGSNRRTFNHQWARNIRDVCQVYSTPFMFKQGAAFMSGKDRVLDGRTWDETPFAPAPDVVQKPYQVVLL